MLEHAFPRLYIYFDDSSFLIDCYFTPYEDLPKDLFALVHIYVYSLYSTIGLEIPRVLLSIYHHGNMPAFESLEAT